MNLYDIRTGFLDFLRAKVPSEVVAMDYLPEDASNGGVSFNMDSFQADSGIDGMPQYRKAYFEVFVDKLSRRECDEVAEAVMAVQFRESHGIIKGLTVTGFSDFIRDPANERFFSSRITFTALLG